MPDQSTERYVVKVQGHQEFMFDANTFNPDWIAIDEHHFHLRDGMSSWNIQVTHFDPAARMLQVVVNGKSFQVSIATPLDRLIQELGFSTQVVHKAKELRAPMPGTVLEVFVQPGQEIREGDKLLILEAMKMENVLKAPGDGVVKGIEVKTGSAVSKNEVLIVLE